MGENSCELYTELDLHWHTHQTTTRKAKEEMSTESSGGGGSSRARMVWVKGSFVT